MSDILEKNTVLITVPESIITGKTFNAIDYNEPLTFLNFIVRTNPTETDSAYLVQQYRLYLLEWYKYKKIDKTDSTDFVRLSFITFLREVLLNFSSLEERRFVSNANYSNDLDLYSVLPFFTKKIKEICNYYSLLRQNVPFKKYENALKGSQTGVVTLLKNEIYKTLQAVEIVSNQTNLFSLSAIKNNLSIEVKELFDDSQYFDLNPNYDSATYNNAITSNFYSSNLNDFNSTLFTDFDTTIVDAITTYPFYITDFKTSYSINYQVFADDLQYLKDRDFINQINNQNRNNLNLNLEKELIEKFIGTDYYYLSTGNTINDIVSGVLFKAQDKSTNLLNKRFPSTASFQNESNLKNIRQIGGFFLPDKLGVLHFNNFKYSIDVDKNILTPNKLYVFPDPHHQGNISNLSLTDFDSPIIYEEDVSWMHYNRTAQYLFANVVSNPLYKNFYAYHSRSETLGYQPIGMSRDVDSTEFFTGSAKSIWDNSDVFPVTDNELPIDERQFNLLAVNKTLTKYRNDLYGNNYGLYKEINPVGVGLDGTNRGDFISQEELDFFNFTGGRAGLYGTGRKGLNLNQFTALRVKPCLLLDGYLFYDFDKGFNIDLTIPNPDKDISGVTTRTVTQIPPGSGYYTRINAITASSTPLINYTFAFPYSPPPTFSPLPAPILVIAYGNGHFCENTPEGDCIDTYCDIFKVNYCLLLDCLTYLDSLSNQRLDFSSDSPQWDTAIPVYYSELLEGSLTNTFTKPNNVDRATFSYTFAPSAQVIAELDAFRFNLGGKTPCAITNTIEFPSPEILNYNNDVSQFVNLAVPENYKTSVKSLSTNLTKSKSIYDSRYVTEGILYYKNANTAKVESVQNALSSVYEKYPSIISDSIKSGVVDFDIIYNVIFVETKDYLIIDKLNYNYQNNNVEPFDSSKNYLPIYSSNKNLEKTSTIFFNEKSSQVYLVRTVLFSDLSCTNTKIIYPEIYKIDIASPDLVKLYPNFETTYQNLSVFTHLDVDTNIERIDKPILSYNEDTQTFLINYFAKNSNNVFVNVFHEFNIKNSNINFLRHIAYKPEFFIKDINFTYYIPASTAGGVTLTNAPSSYQVYTDCGILWFATSAAPSPVAKQFINCDSGIIFAPAAVTPTPQSTPPPTPTLPTPSPSPTPTLTQWTGSCSYAQILTVSGANTTAANGTYVITGKYTTMLSETSTFTVFYQNTTNTNYALVFVNQNNDDSSYIKGAILSASNSTFMNNIGLVYASTSPIDQYACAPYGIYDVVSARTPNDNILRYTSGKAPYPQVQKVY